MAVRAANENLHSRPVGRKFLSRRLGALDAADFVFRVLDRDDYDARFNPAHRVTTLLFRSERGTLHDVVALKREIVAAVARSDLEVLYVMSHAERMQVIYEHLNIILSAILLLSLLVLLVSAIGNASAVGVSIPERTREFGVMRAIGATPQTIVWLLRVEGILVSLLGISLGLLLGYPISEHAAEFFGHLMLGPGAQLAYSFSPLGLVITGLVTFASSLVASSLPVRSALRVPIHQALSYE